MLQLQTSFNYVTDEGTMLVEFPVNVVEVLYGEYPHLRKTARPVCVLYLICVFVRFMFIFFTFICSKLLFVHLKLWYLCILKSFMF